MTDKRTTLGFFTLVLFILNDTFVLITKPGRKIRIINTKNIRHSVKNAKRLDTNQQPKKKKQNKLQEQIKIILTLKTIKQSHQHLANNEGTKN